MLSSFQVSFLHPYQLKVLQIVCSENCFDKTSEDTVLVPVVMFVLSFVLIAIVFYPQYYSFTPKIIKKLKLYFSDIIAFQPRIISSSFINHTMMAP